MAAVAALIAGGKYVGMVSSVTEGMSLVANGLDISAGDAILTTDHEHTGGFTMWELQRDRYGATLLEVPLLVRRKQPVRRPGRQRRGDRDVAERAGVGEIGGTFFGKKVTPNPLQKTLARIGEFSPALCAGF